MLSYFSFLLILNLVTGMGLVQKVIYKAYLYHGYRVIGKQLLKSNDFPMQYRNKDPCRGHTEEKALVLYCERNILEYIELQTNLYMLSSTETNNFFQL